MNSVEHGTCFDIWGDEFLIRKIKYNSKFDIELLYGQKLDSESSGGFKFIVTKEFKAFMDKHESLHATKFGEHLSMNTIKKLRRLFLKNPYKDYVTWRDSTDEDKPTFVTFVNREKSPEYLIDYFGEPFVLASAEISKNGIVLPKGTAKDIYFSNDPNQRGKNNIEYIATKEIVDFVRKNRNNIKLINRELIPSYVAVVNLIKKIGYDRNIECEEEVWMAAHLKDIFSMSQEKFIEKYPDIRTPSMIANFKRSVSALHGHSRRDNSRSQAIVSLVQSLEDGATRNDIIKELVQYIPKTRGEYLRPYRVLMLAREYNHYVPRAMRSVLRKKKR